MKRILFLLATGLSFNIYAADNPNSIGINLGYGTISTKSAVHDASESDSMFAGDVYYRYMVNDYFGAEVGYRATSDTIGNALSTPLENVHNVSYSGTKLSGYMKYDLSQNFNIYGKAGINYYTLKYDIDTDDSHSQNIKKSEIGAEGAIGLGYDFSRLGVNVEYNYAVNKYLHAGTVMIGTRILF